MRDVYANAAALSLVLGSRFSLSLSPSRARIPVLLAFHLELAIPSRFVNGFIYNYRASRSRITPDKYHRKGEGYENSRPMKPTSARGLDFNNARRETARSLARSSIARPHPPPESPLSPPSPPPTPTLGPTDQPTDRPTLRFSVSRFPQSAEFPPRRRINNVGLNNIVIPAIPHPSKSFDPKCTQIFHGRKYLMFP